MGPGHQRGRWHGLPDLRRPLDGAPLHTVSGWRASPEIKDHTAIRFGTGSGLAVEGDIVPSVELALDPTTE